MGKTLEIHSDIVWGTKAGGQGKDYTFLKFVSAPGCVTEDPRKWIKEFHRDANFKPVTIFALRVEQDGIMFLIWSQTKEIGERDGDGRYTYLYVPSDIKISGRDICNVLSETKRLSEETGKLSPEFENEKEWPYQTPVSLPTDNRDENKYGYVHYGTEQELIEILDQRHQKAFGMYKWVALSDIDAKKFIKSGISVDDITSKVKQKYVLWEPSKYARGDWSPVLKNGKEPISPNTYIYSDEAIFINWTYKDNRFRYDGYTKISSFDDLSSNELMDKYFKTSKILSPRPIKISGEQVSETDLVYHGNTRDVSIEIVNKKHCVYLSEAETLKLEKLELKNKVYSLQIEGDGVVISKRNSAKRIYFEDDYLCRIDENGRLTPPYGKNKPTIIDVPHVVNEKKITFKRNEIAYFLKHKWWFLLVIFVIGLLAGFSINNMLSGHTKESTEVVDSTSVEDIVGSNNAASNECGTAEAVDVSVGSSEDKGKTEQPSNDKKTGSEATKQEDTQICTLTFSSVSENCAVTVNGKEFSGGNMDVDKGTDVIIKVTPPSIDYNVKVKADNKDLSPNNNAYVIKKIKKNMIIIITAELD